jgi:hypothetical protein
VLFSSARCAAIESDRDGRNGFRMRQALSLAADLHIRVTSFNTALRVTPPDESRGGVRVSRSEEGVQSTSAISFLGDGVRIMVTVNALDSVDLISVSALL